MHRISSTKIPNHANIIGYKSGDRIANRYVLLQPLGEGGFGSVWKAEDAPNEKDQKKLYVALKFLKAENQGNKKDLEKTLDNYHKVHNLYHPHIAAYTDIVIEGDTRVLIMEFVDGKTLDIYREECIEKRGKIEFSSIVHIARQIAEGLDFAHEKNIIHRDIRIRNVMIVNENNDVKILDFGEAEILDSFTQYNSEYRNLPRGHLYTIDPVDPKADQQALAALVYYLVSGIPLEIPLELAQQPPSLKELTVLQNNAIQRAFAKNPANRFNNCVEFMTALGAVESESVKEWMSTREISIGTKNRQGLTLMHFAARDGRVDVMNWLKVHGENVNEIDNEGKTPLFYAATSGRVDVATWLKSHECDVNAKSKDGRTSMHHAAGRGFCEFMGVLKKLGAAVDVEDNDGQTPMFSAAINGRVDAMIWLKKEDARIDASDKRGQTPFFLAACANSVAAMRWLKEEGVDITAIDNIGKTVASVIKQHGSAEAREWLNEQNRSAL